MLKKDKKRLDAEHLVQPAAIFSLFAARIFKLSSLGGEEYAAGWLRPA
jgi:hypothetical protein